MISIIKNHKRFLIHDIICLIDWQVWIALPLKSAFFIFLNVTFSLSLPLQHCFFFPRLPQYSVCHALHQGLFETGIPWNAAQKCPVGNSHTREAVLFVILAILFYTCASLSLFFYKASLDYSSTDIYVLSCLHILMWAAVPTCCKGLWRKVWYVCICVF